MPETKTKKSDDFNEWYNEIVELADLCDKRYPIKGMNVWKPYGWTLMTNVDRLIRTHMNRTHHQEVYFPLLIPESFFKKEEEHIEGFGSEVFWITHAGANKLEERWLLRPTSETAMYPIFSLWIRAHTDLPLKTFQIVNTFRYETKQTRAFIRVREIHFFEAHTCHKDEEDAERQIKEDKEIANQFLNQLSLPYLLSIRPDWDKFAGAVYTVSIDVLMPSLRTLQIGSIHQYHENFAKPYEITYETEQGTHKPVHQTTYGMSERLLGAVVGVHGDNKGLILPPEVAPIQVVIIPIIFKGKEKEVLSACSMLEESLHKQQIRTHLDNRDSTPGNKYYEWELKGVPLRVEIGPRDIKEKKMVLVRRDKTEKTSIPLDTAEKEIQKTLQDIKESLFQNAHTLLENNMHRVSTLQEATRFSGIIELPWCGNEKCALEIENILEGNTIGKPVDTQECPHPCPICNKPGVTWMRYAKSY